MSCRFHTFVWILLVTTTTVSQGLEWIQQPSNTSIVQGGDVRINCSWSGQLSNSLAVWTSPSGVPLFVNNQSMTTDPRISIVGIFNLQITNVSKTDQGFYTCAIGTNSAKGYLDVLVSPHNTQVQINNTQQYVENDVLSFTCSSTGNPAPTIHWYRGSSRLVNSDHVQIVPTETEPDGASEKKSTSRLVLTLQHTDDNKTFYCYAFNSVNEDTPVKFPNYLDVHYAPRATLQPAPYNILLGTSGQLACSVNANPPVTQVQWQKDGQLLSSSAMQYQFINADRSETGVYQCTARNQIKGQDHTDTVSTQVNVIYEPIISVVNEVRVNESSNLNMRCEVDANPQPLSVKWKKVDGSTESSGADFIVSSVTREYTGNYSCIVEYELNPSGQAVVRNQKLAYTYVRVQYAPGPASISAATNPISIGQSLILDCSVSDPGFPNPMFEWKRLNDDTTFSETGSRLTTSRSTLQDNGNYSCTPYNLMGRGGSAIIAVDVHEQPSFVDLPPNTQTILSNQTGFFISCKVRGRPVPQIQWYRNGQMIQTGSEYTIQFITETVDTHSYLLNSQLFFHGQGSSRGLTINDIANFTCAESSTLQHILQLYILFKPSVDPDERVAATANQTTILSCTVQGYPIPQFNWYRDQTLIVTNSKYAFEFQSSGVAIVTSRLIIQDVQSSDYGEYVCIVQNQNGSANKKITLTVKDKPEPPSSLSYLSHTWESVYLRWNAGFNGGEEQSFFIHYTSYAVPGSTKDIPVLPNTATEFNITELMPGTSYEFRVYGRNSLGRGNYSDPLTIQTKDLAFPVIRETPEYDEETKTLSVPFTLNTTYCLRIKISTSHGATWKTVILNNKDCFPVENSAVPFSISDEGVNKVNVSLCLTHRQEVCGTHLSALVKLSALPTVAPASKQQPKSDLTETEVIIIGCVCAFILISLLIVLIVIICRRRYRNAKPYRGAPNQTTQVVTQVNGNGSAPPKPRRGQDNPDSVPDRNGIPVHRQFSHPNGNIPHDSSFDSQLAKYENEMNMRNIDNMRNDPYLGGPHEFSLGGGSPSTPRKDPQQFLDISEDRKDGSVKSGQESGYSTPDGQKPKKVHSIRGRQKIIDRNFEKVYYSDYVPFAHDPPGHTCGLPCCNSDLYKQSRIGGHHGGCMSVPFQQDHCGGEDNFTLRRNQKELLKGRPTFKNTGFMSVQVNRQRQKRPPVIKFATINSSASDVDSGSETQKHFIQGRGITLPRLEYMESTDKGNESKSDTASDESSSSDTDNNTGECPTKIRQKENGVDEETPRIYPWNFVQSRQRFGQEGDDADVSESESNYYDEIVMSNFRLCDKPEVEDGSGNAGNRNDDVFPPRLETTYCTLSLDKNMISDLQRHTLERVNGFHMYPDVVGSENADDQYEELCPVDDVYSYSNQFNMKASDSTNSWSSANLANRKSRSLEKYYVTRSSERIGDTTVTRDLKECDIVDKKPIKSALKTSSLQPGINLSRYVESKNVKDKTNQSLKISKFGTTQKINPLEKGNVKIDNTLSTSGKSLLDDNFTVMVTRGKIDSDKQTPITLIL